jgi:hypothetical protein
MLDRFSSVCVRHILVSVRCSLFDQHVSRRLPEHLPSVLQFASAVFDSFGVGDTVAVAAHRGVACGGLTVVEEMAEGEALGAVLGEGEDEWDLREGCSVQSGACVGGIRDVRPIVTV